MVKGWCIKQNLLQLGSHSTRKQKTVVNKKENAKSKKWNLFDCENMKKDVAGGMGWIVVAALTSDIRRGRADTAPFSFSSSSSLTKPSSSSSANQMCSEKKLFFFWEFSDLIREIIFHFYAPANYGWGR